MQTIMQGAEGKPRSARRSALGFLIAPLLAGRTTAERVIKRHFDGSPLALRLRRALRHGSLVDGRIRGAYQKGHGATAEHVAAGVDRPLHHRSARRMLACFLMLVEQMDPETGAASGRKLWQGTHARRIGLSLRRDQLGRLGGVREVQRYLRIFDRADVLCRNQPNADRVPEHMKARPKLSTFAGGVRREAQWAYNKVWTPPGYPLPQGIRNTLRRWRGQPAVPIVSSARTDRGPETPQLEAVERLRDLMAYLEGRPRPDAS